MKRVGRHTIVRQVESAGPLSTYEATLEERAVRLRVFDAGIRPNRDAARRFETDLSTAATLKHPSVEPPLAWSVEQPPHASTAHRRAAVLADLCAKAPQKRLGLDRVVGMAGDLAEALHAAHTAGVVHAGLSLDSILLGTDGRARVTDFGLMRLLNDLSVAHPQIMRETIESQAPEQVSAPETVGPHTDVFGLGLVVYRALIGKAAFEAPSALGVSIRLSMGNATPIDSHDVEIPDELKALVMKMLHADSAARPSMDQVASTLSTLAHELGPWRESLRALAETAAPRAERESAASSSPSSSPSSSSPEQEGEGEMAEEPASDPAPKPPPRGEALASAEAEPPEISFDAPPAGAAPRGDRAVVREPWPPPAEPASGAKDVAALASPAFLGLADLDSAVPTFVERLEPATELNVQLPDDRYDASGPGDIEWTEAMELPADGVEDTSELPPVEASYDVPKTVMIKAPPSRPPPPRLDAPPPPPIDYARANDPAPSPAPVAEAGLPPWAVWTAIALGAFALLVGTATFIILITG